MPKIKYAIIPVIWGFTGCDTLIASKYFDRQGEEYDNLVEKNIFE